jgi:hypothetical protein
LKDQVIALQKENMEIKLNSTKSFDQNFLQNINNDLNKNNNDYNNFNEE